MKKETNIIEDQPTRVGRPPIDKNRKKGKKIFVNLTESQRKQLDQLAEKDDISLSRICINALKEVGYLT